MTPFREKPVKWDGDDGGGRYENDGGYKYDIINQTVVRQREEMPEYFLADDPEEAQALHDRFSKILNTLSYNYSVATGLLKSDLFGEALIGLARANRDWDPKRSKDFKTYAIYRIKDALREFCIENASSIRVPMYIRIANNQYNELVSICESYDIPVEMLVFDQEIPHVFEPNDAVRAAELVTLLINAANRTNVSMEKFVHRVQAVPSDELFENQLPPEVEEMQSRQLEAALVVDKLKQHMTQEEMVICSGIMNDLSYEEIAQQLGKSKGWVSGKLKSFKQRMLEMADSGKL
jgi:RNA polymerase sigma factor (sigma-70 family)